ncbi:MAG: trigger factor family protein, partial [Eubacterium sp.]
MSAKILSNEKNVATIEIEVSAEDFQKAIKQSYNKNKKRYSVQGFRKGKAPKKIIEAYYGQGVFYEDAIDFAFPDAYKSALEETEIEPASRPEFDKVDKIGEDGATFIVKVALKPE